MQLFYCAVFDVQQLLQSQGGPCGILAAVQGYVLKEFFHSNETSERKVDVCLAKALAGVLWRIKCENGKHDVVLAV